MTQHSVKDRYIVIGASAKNLGGLVARDLAAHGAAGIAVHYHSDESKSAAEDTVRAVQEAGAQAFSIQSDLTRPDNVTSLFDAAQKQFGRVDIAINTTGMVLRKPILETSEAEYDQMFAINAKAAYFFIKEAGRTLADGGKIITILTSLLTAFTDGYSTYASGKSPVEHFARAAAKEFGTRGISVSNIAPGPMDTPFFYPQETPERVAFHKSMAMNNDLTQIADIAPIVRFLAGEGWWITGQAIFANGGYTTR